MSSLLDAIKNKRQAIAAKSGRERPLKLTNSKNLVRILPRWDGNESGTFWQDFGQHFIKDKSGQVQAVYVCTANTFGKVCEVCSGLAEHSAATMDEDVVSLIQEARGSSRALVNAIYLNGTHANAKTAPVLLELPQSVLNDILGIMETYMEDHELNIVALKDGYDLVITKSGSGRDTRYTVTPSPKNRALAADVLKDARDLEVYANQEYDEGRLKVLNAMRAVLGGGSDAPAYGTPAGRPALEAPASTAASLSETEILDLEALEVDADDLDTVAATPAPAAKAKKAPVVETVAAPSVSDEMDELDALMAEAGVA